MVTSFVLFESLFLLGLISLPNLFIAGLLRHDWASVAVHTGHAAMFTSCCVLAFYCNGLYDPRRIRTCGAFIRRVSMTLGLLTFLLAGAYWVDRALTIDLLPPLQSVAHYVVPLVFLLLLRSALYPMINSRFLGKRVIILGTGPLAQMLAQEVDTSLYLQYKLLGYVDDNGYASTEATLGGHPILGQIELIGKIIEQQQPDLVIVALTERRMRLPVWDLLQSRVNGVMIKDGIEVYERCTGKLALEQMTPSHLLFSKDFNKSTWLTVPQQFCSSAVAAIGLILTVPLMAIIALAIKLDSQGPVFFIQERAGLRGRIFRLVKFRTMHPSTDVAGSVWERDITSRLTRVGKLLRKFYLDELPQLFNILRGDMGLIGPRPEMASNIATMAEHIPYYTVRSTIRPGLTGWAQIKHGYALTQEEVTEKMRYDLYYVKNMSLGFDLRIILGTAKNMLLRRGT